MKKTGISFAETWHVASLHVRCAAVALVCGVCMLPAGVSAQTNITDMFTDPNFPGEVYAARKFRTRF